MCGAELTSLPEGVQRVARVLQDKGHAHMPQMLSESARTARLISSEPPGASSHTLPARPRPALCVSARISSGVSTPAASRSRATSLVEVTASSRSTWIRREAPRPPDLVRQDQMRRAAPSVRDPHLPAQRCR